MVNRSLYQKRQNVKYNLRTEGTDRTALTGGRRARQRDRDRQRRRQREGGRLQMKEFIAAARKRKPGKKELKKR